MEQQQFKTESKRILDLMINSIYTHKEIFLREIISNASDAMDKLAYRSLTEDKEDINRLNFRITLTPDATARTLTIEDTGIGMTHEELENNLGTIAKSGSLQFKKEVADTEGLSESDLDIIGQFGVGFYSAFMVADKLTVTTRGYGCSEAWCWESTGADGYTITPCEKASVGSKIVITLKESTEEENYDLFLDQNELDRLVKKYSDYVHFPIAMEREHTRAKERPADAGEDYETEYETYTEWDTLNSMVPLWQRPKSEVDEQEYNDFYKEKYGDWQDPLSVIHVSVEGNVEYKAMLYIPSQPAQDFASREFEKGLQLYSSGVMIMEKCPDLLSDHFRFVRGVVDSADFSLNISREMLQQTRQLKIVANNLEKKIKAELLRIQKNEREKYETFWKSFGLQIKVGTLNDFGAHKDALKDLLIFHSSKENKMVTLAEYVEKMAEDQQFIYYACGESAQQIARLPQVERIADKGYDILCLTDEPDEFVMQVLHDMDGKALKSVADADALPESDEEKAATEKKTEENKSVLDFVTDALDGKVKETRISKVLKSGAVCLSMDGPVSLEMAKYFLRMNPESASELSNQQILELNADNEVFAALRMAVVTDPERAKQYAQLLYHQAQLIAGLPLEDPVAYSELVCALMK